MECPLSKVPMKEGTNVTYTFELDNVDFQQKESFLIDSKLYSKCNGDPKVDTINSISVNLQYVNKLESKGSKKSTE